MNTKKKFVFVIALLFVATFFMPVNTASAATTTTKYLNGKIVFDSDRSGNAEIYIMDADGGNVTRLTNSSNHERNPSWSPDGTKVAFDSYTADFSSLSIYIMDADGGNQTNIAASGAHPRWSPDGAQLVFVRSSEIYTMDADGGNVTRLTNNALIDNQPIWSPDGTKIAFHRFTADFSSMQVYIMDVNGSNQTNISNNAAKEYSVAWSPDGSKLAFSSNRDNSPNPSNPDLYSTDINGNNVVRITSTVNQEDSVAFSPDGTKLLSTIYPDENYNSSEVFSINLDGTNRTQLTNGGGYDESYSPQSWQPLPYLQTTNDNGTITSTIASTSNYSSTNYTVVSGETLILDGTLCDVTVESGGTLIGTGSIAPDCTLTIEPGGTIAPGHSPGCLTSGNLILSGTYQAELAGTTACTEYDQLQVTGTVTVSGALNVSLLNGFVPVAGNSFTIIQNDGSDPVVGTFTGLPEGATVTVSSTVFKISYMGGTGNDVILTAQAVPGVPATGYEKISPVYFLIMFGVSIIGITGFIALRKFKGDYE